MAQTVTEVKLSGSTDGRLIKVVPTATLGTTIHTAHATSLDEIYLWAQNNHSAAVLLTIEFGGVSSPDDLIQITLPSKGGLSLIVPGLPLTNGKVVTAFAATANVISIGGRVLRVT